MFYNEIFPPNDESEGWDRQFNGNNAIQGFYIYSIKTVDDKGNIVESVGQLNLSR